MHSAVHVTPANYGTLTLGCADNLVNIWGMKLKVSALHTAPYDLNSIEP